MATIYDVAKHAGVSVATVSAVVNESSFVSPGLRRRVEAAIESLHYTPNLLARSLALKRTNTLGMLIPDIANPFYSGILRGAEDRAQKSGYAVIVGNSDNRVEKEHAYLNLFLSKRVDGILLIKAPGEMSESTRVKLRNAATPIVLLDRDYAPLETHAVLADDFGGAKEAVQHLIRHQHRRIGIIIGPPHVSTTQGRLAGYKQALLESDIPFDLGLVAEGDYDIQQGFEAGLLLLQQKPTAVFVTNWTMTVGFLQAIEKRGFRCPADLALVSYDDFIWTGLFQPKLTSVAQPAYQLGYRGTEILLGCSKGKYKRRKVEILKNELVIRESCGGGCTSTADRPPGRSYTPGCPPTSRVGGTRAGSTRSRRSKKST